jgi:hypothetical protein
LAPGESDLRAQLADLAIEDAVFAGIVDRHNDRVYAGQSTQCFNVDADSSFPRKLIPLP